MFNASPGLSSSGFSDFGIMAGKAGRRLRKARLMDEHAGGPSDGRKENAENSKEVDERPEPELVRAASFRT
jgi:hypothetical protein